MEITNAKVFDCCGVRVAGTVGTGGRVQRRATVPDVPERKVWRSGANGGKQRGRLCDERRKRGGTTVPPIDRAGAAGDRERESEIDRQVPVTNPVIVSREFSSGPTGLTGRSDFWKVSSARESGTPVRQTIHSDSLSLWAVNRPVALDDAGVQIPHLPLRHLLYRDSALACSPRQRDPARFGVVTGAGN